MASERPDGGSCRRWRGLLGSKLRAATVARSLEGEVAGPGNGGSLQDKTRGQMPRAPGVRIRESQTCQGKGRAGAGQSAGPRRQAPNTERVPASRQGQGVPEPRGQEGRLGRLPVTSSSELELQEKVAVQSRTHEQDSEAQNKGPTGRGREIEGQPDSDENATRLPGKERAFQGTRQRS